MALLRTLCDAKRFTGGRREIILLLLYSPIGLCLFSIRILLTIGLAGLLFVFFPMRYIHSKLQFLMFLVWGIYVSTDTSLTGRKSKARLLVSNHITSFDCIPISMCTDSIMVIVSDFPQALSRLIRIETIPSGLSESDYLRMLINNTEPTFLYFPEEATTNGKGLLKFSTWWCSAVSCVQPISLTAWSPFPHINLAPLGCKWYINLLVQMFLPFTSYKVKYLSVVNIQPGRPQEVLAERAERMIMTSLNISVTRFTAEDKENYEKAYFDRIRRGEQVNDGDSGDNEDIRGMVDEVVSLLPHAPKTDIIRDLEVTDDVTTTVENISRQFPPPPLDSSSSESDEESNNQSEPETPRVLSAVLTRRQKFIESARERYLERHGLKEEEE